MVLNYIPLTRKQSLKSGSNLKLPAVEAKEGLYDETEGRGTDFATRKRNIEEI